MKDGRAYAEEYDRGHKHGVRGTGDAFGTSWEPPIFNADPNYDEKFRAYGDGYEAGRQAARGDQA